MKQRKLSIFTALLLLVGGAMAQVITEADVQTTVVGSARIRVNIADATDVTALQMNVSLPEGFNFVEDSENHGIVLSGAANDHTISVNPLASGDLLVVIYSMTLDTFSDGTLMSIPVVVANGAASGEGRLYAVRTSTADAVSSTSEDVTFVMDEISVTNVSLSETTATLAEGGILVLEAFVKPFNATNQTVRWSSSNTNVATVADGVVTAVAAGTATITATAGNYSASCEITVEAAAEPTPEPEGLSTSKYYRVKNVTTGLYLQVEGNNTNMKLQNKAEGLAMMQIFGLEDAGEEKYYIKAADADSLYYAHASGWDFNATTNADNKTPFTIALVEGETSVYTLHQSVSEYQGLAGADNSEAGSPIYCNKGIDNNGKWAFEALTAEEQAAYVAALRPITSLDELSNSKAYYVKQPQRASGTSWAVETGAEALKSNADLGIGVSCKDNRQHFAFLTNNEGGTYYLYHVAEAKFVAKDGSLSTQPVDAVYFTDGQFENTFVVYFDTDHYINVGGSSQMVIDGWNTPDEGNSCTLTPVADFDATAALAAIEALETGVEKSEIRNEKSEMIYDLTGRRVEKMEKGIYIVGGKKVMIK